VDDGGAGVDHRLDRLREVFAVGAAGVLGRVLDLVAEAPGVLHRFDTTLDHLLPGEAQLALDVDVGSGEHDVDLRALGVLDRPPHGLDVRLHGAGQRGDHGAPDLTGDGLAGLEVA